MLPFFSYFLPKRHASYLLLRLRQMLVQIFQQIGQGGIAQQYMLFGVEQIERGQGGQVIERRGHYFALGTIGVDPVGGPVDRRSIAGGK